VRQAAISSLLGSRRAAEVRVAADAARKAMAEQATRSKAHWAQRVKQHQRLSSQARAKV
jgi:hypothetical protein